MITKKNNIRLATKADLECIMQITEKIKQHLHSFAIPQWQGDYPTRDVFDADIVKKTLWVYEENDGVYAFINVSFEEEKTYRNIDGAWLRHQLAYSVIHRMAVDHTHHKKGIGRKLFLKAITESKKQKVASVRVDTHARNQPMRELISSCGFIYCGIIWLDDSMDVDQERLAYEYVL